MVNCICFFVLSWLAQLAECETVDLKVVGVCVSLASSYGGVTVKHAIPIASDPP